MYARPSLPPPPPPCAGLPSGLSVQANVAKECEEEAGFAPHLAARAVPAQCRPGPPSRPGVPARRLGAVHAAQLVQHSAGPEVRVGKAGSQLVQPGFGGHEPVGEKARRGQGLFNTMV